MGLISAQVEPDEEVKQAQQATEVEHSEAPGEIGYHCPSTDTRLSRRQGKASTRARHGGLNTRQRLLRAAQGKRHQGAISTSLE